MSHPDPQSVWQYGSMADGKPIAYMLQVQWLYEYSSSAFISNSQEESDWPNIADAPGALAAWCILDFRCHCGQLLWVLMASHFQAKPDSSISASRIFPKSLILQSAWISLHIGTGSLCQVDMGELSPPRRNFQLEDRSQSSLLSFRRMILRHILYAFSDGSQ